MEKGRLISSSESAKQQGMLTNLGSFECLLRQFGELKDLSLGRCLHAYIIESGHEKNGFYANLLLQMYGKCQALKDAHWLHSTMQQKDVYSWTFMIGAYAQLGQSKDALHIFHRMQTNEVNPNPHTFIYLLSACATKAALVDGRHVHTFILSSGFEQDTVVATALVCMYGKCGSPHDALHVFETCKKDTISWNAIISMVSEQGHDVDAQRLFQQMQVEGLIPTKATFLNFLIACADQPILSKIKRIHTFAVSCEFHVDIAVVNALITMYGKCGSTKDAQNAFERMPVQNVISWTAIIAAYAEQGQSKEVVQALRKMLYRGVTPDKVTFASSLVSCVKEASLVDGLWLHSCVCDSGFDLDVVVGTALVSMYGKCGCVESAWKVFKKLPERDTVCWNALIAAYDQHGHGKEALEFVREMGMADLVPGKITFLSILDACANEAALDDGRWIHACLMQYDFQSEVVITNALLNMYAKCGNLVDAQYLFDRMPERSVVSWSAVIAAYGQQGGGKESLILLDWMRVEGMLPTEVTFVSVLSACSHAGMVEEAWECVVAMKQEGNTTATAELYDCLVDLLSRAGLLLQGQALIGSMPFQPNSSTWMTFLGACKMHNDSSPKAMGSAALHVLEVDSDTAAPYVLLSNICSLIREEKKKEFLDGVDEDHMHRWDRSLMEAL